MTFDPPGGVNIVSARTTPGRLYQEMKTPQAKAKIEPLRKP